MAGGAWDLRVRAGSPVLNAGSNAGIPLAPADVEADMNLTEALRVDSP